MANILICDSSKPSVVMTSEIFKDKLPGALVQVASTGFEALELIKTYKPDICVVDFDLPDVDGPTLIALLRKEYSGPIIMTAFPDKIVDEAVRNELFTCNDAARWVKKPVTFQAISDKIDTFLVDKHRIDRRFSSNFSAHLVARAAGRGKRAPKAEGRVVNMSISGACMICDDTTAKLKKTQEVVLTISSSSAKKTLNQRKGGAQSATGDEAVFEATVKGEVAWIESKGRIGILFSKLSDVQRKEITAFLRASDPSFSVQTVSA